jgi:hypothetical protein
MYSKRWFPYTKDDGTVVAVLRDESNTELVDSAADGLTPPSGTPPLEQGVKARYVTLQNAAGQQKDCTVLNVTQYNALSLSQAFAGTNEDGTVAGDSWVLVRKTPEISRRQPVNFDTGLTDGDQP